MRLLYVFLAFSTFLGANDRKSNLISYQIITPSDGLASKEVYHTVKDRYGYLWIGTNQGLNRFDGREFLSLQQGLLGNKIIQLTPLPNQEILITYGIKSYQLVPEPDFQILNPIDFSLSRPTELFPESPFQLKDLVWVEKDRELELWHLITKKPFTYWQYSEQKGTERIETFPEGELLNLNVLMSSFSKNLTVIKLGNQLFFLFDGQRVPLPAVEPEFFFQLDDHPYLLSHTGSQIEQRVLYEKSWKKIPVDSSLSNLKTYLAPLGIPIDNGDGYFINSENNGLIYYTSNGSVEIFAPTVVQELGGFRINHARKDFGNIYWLSTSIGLIKVSIQSNHFDNQFTRADQQELSLNQVRGILEYPARSGSVLANVWNKLVKIELGKPPVIFPIDFETNLFPIIELDGLIYLANDRLIALDPRTQRIIYQSPSFQKEIWTLYPTESGSILVGIRDSIYEFFPSSQTFQLIPVKEGANYPFIPYRTIEYEENEIWWICQNGVYRFNEVGQMELIFYPNEIQLFDLAQTKDGVYWGATSKGLWRLGSDWRKWKEESYEFSKDWGHFSMYRMEVDDQENIWISTDKGLIQFQPNSGLKKVYLKEDGLVEEEFNRIASVKLHDGRIVMGGINGLTLFNPSDFLFDSAPPQRFPLVLNHFTIQNKEGDIRSVLEDYKFKKPITYQTSDRTLNLDFILLDYSPQAAKYSYRIVTIEKDWIPLNTNSLRLFQLPYGTHKIEIKAEPFGQSTRISTLTLPISVARPFYLQMPFWIGFLLLSIALLMALFQYRTYALQQRNKTLEDLVSNRTVELKKALKDRERLLQEIHHRVKNNLQIISGLLHLQKRSIEDKAGQKALNDGQSRINSIALIHQNLYESEQLASIQFLPFFNDLIFQIKDLFENPSKVLKVHAGQLDWTFDVDTAVPLGIILNELITNSYKYSLPNQQEVVIQVAILEVAEGDYQLQYQDNGPGLQSNIEFKTVKTLGLKLIKGLARQLGGTATYHFDRGSHFTITFKEIFLRKKKA